jgi:hypothetical protein
MDSIAAPPLLKVRVLSCGPRWRACGDVKVFWSNFLVGSITTLAILLLFWPVIDKAFGGVWRRWRPEKI